MQYKPKICLPMCNKPEGVYKIYYTPLPSCYCNNTPFLVNIAYDDVEFIKCPSILISENDVK